MNFGQLGVLYGICLTHISTMHSHVIFLEGIYMRVKISDDKTIM